MNRYVLRKYVGRWILAQEGNERYAWSGARWVEIGGSVQVCNFETAMAAHFYAQDAGLVPGGEAA